MTTPAHRPPFRLTATVRPGDDPELHIGHWRVVVYTPGPSHVAPRRFRGVVTIGYVFREGSYGWTAATVDVTPQRQWGGYRLRSSAASVLFDNWRASNLRVALLVDGVVIPPVIDDCPEALVADSLR